MTNIKARPIVSKQLMRQHWPTILVTVVALIGLFIVWQLLQQRREQNLRDIFVHESQRITTKIDERVSAYGQILRSGAGLFAASEKVERAEWATFVEKLDLDQSYRGIQGVGFSLYIPKLKLAAHQSEMRKLGFPDYVVKPEGDRDEYTSIIYLEPFSGRNLRAFGYDMYSEATRNAAMAHARDVGDVIFSGRVKLVQETKADVQAGLLAYYPVYRNSALTQTIEQRRAALVGWVYSPYRMNDLMAPILAEELDTVRLQIFDGDAVSDAHLLYDSEQGIAAQAVASGDSFTFTQKLELSGRYWTLRYTTLPGFAATQRFSSEWGDLATLLLVGMLVLGLSGSLIGTRRRAEAIAQQLIGDLRVSEQRYDALFAKSRVPMMLIDPIDGQILEGNAAAADFYGYRLDQLKAMNIGQINILTSVQIATEMQLAVNEQRAYFNFSHRLADGSIRDVEVHSGPIEVHGRHLLYSIVVDVTKRRHAEEAMVQQSQRMSNILWGTGVGTWEWNVQTGETRVNERWAELIGYTLDELAPVSIATWMKYAHPDDLAASGAALEKHFAGEIDYYECESRMRHKDGHWIWVLDRGKLVSRTPDRLPEWMAGTHTDITVRKSMEIEIRQLAYFDALTGLPNRRLLNDRLNHAMASSKRNGLYGALMFLDLDNFKPLNDTHGHVVGDLLLIEVAHRLSACVREMDTVARLGGDEFVVMLSELEADKAQATAQAGAVAEKIRATLAEPYHLTVVQSGEEEKSVEHRCSASIGLVMFIDHEASQADLLKWADAAMYQAKDTGRNKVSFYLNDPKR
jgi:diguanylate cyclase (GGDEF)-like protein/PAS domain S-box-containing protein